MRLEPTAVEMFEFARDAWGKKAEPVPHEQMMHIIAISQAESLKRIADALWGTEGTSGVIELLNGIEASK